MSTRALTWAFGLRLGGRPSEKLVLIDLADHADDHYRAWPRVRLIAARTELSEATCMRSLRYLRDWGLIEWERRRSMIGRPRSNLYTLRLDRSAPLELAETAPEQTVTMTDGTAGDENLEAGSDGYDGPDEADYHHDRHESEPADSHGDSHVPRTVTVTNRTVTTEPCKPPTPNDARSRKPSRPSAPDAPLRAMATPDLGQGEATLSPGADAETGSAREGNSAETLAEGFHEAEETYQQMNLIKFFGDKTANWKYWRGVPFDARVKALSRLPNYLRGCKAAFARWAQAKPGERGRKPGVSSFKEYLATEIYETVGVPSPETLAKNEADLAAGKLCRSIALGERMERPLWVPAGTEEFSAWLVFFRAHGQRLSPRRARFADQHDLGAKAGEEGWRFPTRWPPGSGPSGSDESEDEAISA